MLVFWPLVLSRVVLAVYLLFLVSAFLSYMRIRRGECQKATIFLCGNHVIYRQ